MSIRVVLCTAPNEAVAKNIAQALIAEKKAACVNIVANVQSVYEWQGSVETDSEHQLIIKTTHERLNEAYALMCKHHPYDVPEWVVLEAHASPAYGSWLLDVVNNA
ncbi:divalent cation tolerance protein CutA [Alteromonas sp. 345S023]|jgi:periplasmic divalent cation tolerance protein|uniref:Divalent cation tolerance protein CutA n=1 Tax=Alteromonas profundi TaxID=2696062 RepID=A0A7X5LNA6_9ALTE|nr:divalent-cation tolerance protein CutA [Alteromonas profundi]NDV92473.1 divalent cation tolerance protein CutA [Alteromonas profundi]